MLLDKSIPLIGFFCYLTIVGKPNSLQLVSHSLINYISLSLLTCLVDSPNFFSLLSFSERCGSCGLCNHGTHSTGYILVSVCTCLHWVHLQETFTCFLPGHLGLLGCHGLPFYVFGWNHLSMGSGKNLWWTCDACCDLLHVTPETEIRAGWYCSMLYMSQVPSLFLFILVLQKNKRLK